MSSTGYSLHGYGAMVADRRRMEAYRDALRHSISPGCAVVDIGTGIGVTAVLARQLGAGRVIAIEPDDAIALGPALDLANGGSGQITWIQNLSTSVALDAPADVLLSDLRGVLPLNGNHIPALIDARQRLLKQGGALIPERDRIHVALVSSAQKYEPYQGYWDASWLHINLEPARAKAVGDWRKIRLRAEELFSEARLWTEIDYRTVDSADVAGTVHWDVDRDGTVHGIAAWFDTDLAPGISFSNNPAAPELLYGQAFFPFEHPLILHPGERVTLDLRAHLRGGEYVWIWCTDVTNSATGMRRAALRQSTLGDLRQIDENRTVELSSDGKTTLAILHRLAEGSTVRATAEWLCTEVPPSTANLASATALVAEVALRYEARDDSRRSWA